MPSVMVHWSGRCQNASVRAELCDRIEQLALALQSLFDKEAVVIRRFDEALRGTILLDSGLLADIPATRKLVRIDEECSRAETLEVFGVEFSVPTLYPGDDRFSFVFVVDDDPALDGLLVHFREPARPSLIHSLHFSTVETGSGTRFAFKDPDAEDREEARVRQSDFYLTAPRIHLRYNLEPWTDDLLGWVKRFYIPDLYYWHWEPLQGYERLRKLNPGNPEQRDRFFRWLASRDAVLREARGPGVSEIPEWFLMG